MCVQRRFRVHNIKISVILWLRIDLLTISLPNLFLLLILYSFFYMLYKTAKIRRYFTFSLKKKYGCFRSEQKKEDIFKLSKKVAQLRKLN